MNTMSPAGAAPAVAGVGEQANGVAPNRWQYVQFNEAMDPSTINSRTLEVTDSSGTAVPGNVTYDANFDIAGFQPNPPLQNNATYTLTVTTAVASAQGVHLPTAYNDTFTTRASTDTSPIFVKSVTPAPNATCVSPTAPITITFSEGAEVSTINSTDILISGPTNLNVPAKISYDVSTATATLTPTSPLPSGNIAVTVQNVADAAGVLMANPYAWSFSTACGGGGGGGSATTQYQAPLFSENGLNVINGQVTVDTKGNTTVKLTGAAPNTSYLVQFCPAVEPGSPNATTPCFVIVTTLSTDSSGNATFTTMFPQSGDWAGDFYVLNEPSGKNAYQTWLAPGVNNETYMAMLLPETKTNGGADTTISSQDPLTSGTVTYSNGSLQFTVKGALPNATYLTTESETTFLDGSGSYVVSTLKTDAMGNGGSTSPMSSSGGDIFQASSETGKDAGFIGGFSVPM
jgi:hypothetical protein